MLCDDLEGWDVGWGGRKAQKGGDACIHIAGSCCCTAETSTTLESGYTPILKILKRERITSLA